MVIDVEKEIARYLSLYFDRGFITRIELINGIAGLATEPGFFDHVDRLPPEVVEGLRERGAHAAAHPEDFADAVAGVLLSHTVTEEMFEEMKRRGAHRGYWIGRLLREHFPPGLPMPTFETMILDGTVTDARMVDGTVVIFGPYGFFIRKNPVHLVTPSGERIVTSVVRQDWILNPQVEVPAGLSEAATRIFVIRHSSKGFFLDARVKTPAEVPPGTQFWVERSAPEKIMPLSEVRKPWSEVEKRWSM